MECATEESTDLMTVFKLPPSQTDELQGLKQTMRRNRQRLEELGHRFPFVWHVNFSLEDYAHWIRRLVAPVAPSINHLTLICLAIRAATDTAEFLWRTGPDYHGLEREIRNLLRIAERGAAYIEGRRCSAPHDEENRILYANHVRNNLDILAALVANGSREERALRISELRREAALD